MIKSKLSNGKVTIGSWISLGNTSIAEIFAKAGFEWIVVDLEHSTIDLSQAGDLIRVIDLCGVSPLVRLTSNDADQIKRVMDAGAHGIVVPMVNTAADAEKAVAATRYSPQGSRGVGLARAQAYGQGFHEYLQWQKDGPLVIVQIEHVNALDNLEAIFSVKGVDAFIIGPYDLSCSMGMPGKFEDDEFVAALRKIRDAGKRFNCPSGIHIVEPDPEQLTESINNCYQFIAYSVDIRMLDLTARQGLETLRGVKK